MIDRICGTVVYNMAILLQINKIIFEKIENLENNSHKSEPASDFNRKLFFF